MFVCLFFPVRKSIDIHLYRADNCRSIFFLWFLSCFHDSSIALLYFEKIVTSSSLYELALTEKDFYQLAQLVTLKVSQTAKHILFFFCSLMPLPNYANSTSVPCEVRQQQSLGKLTKRPATLDGHFTFTTPSTFPVRNYRLRISLSVLSCVSLKQEWVG